MLEIRKPRHREIPASLSGVGRAVNHSRLVLESMLFSMRLLDTLPLIPS